ncbi:MAG: hypothetical protein L0Y56_06125 [Nitrospira sp.]|nr:hypothetical protein [Nitrospira sp.]
MPKVCEGLTKAQKKLIRETAEEVLVDDIMQDRGFCYGVVQTYLRHKNLRFLLETISSESEIHEEVLGFDPWDRGDKEQIVR